MKPMQDSDFAPRLSREHHVDGLCKICNAPTYVFDVVDFNRFCSPEGGGYRLGLAGIPVFYHRCVDCGLIFTRYFDNWTVKNFSDRVYNDEYIKVDGDYVERRPRENAEAVSHILRSDKNVRILDYGSGKGVFSERLREQGFSQVENYDPFSSTARPKGRFDVITCFEVIEHSPDPIGTMTDISSFLADEGEVLFSTALQPVDIDSIRCGWWYASPRNGHVTLFSSDAMARLADRFHFDFRIGDNLWLTRDTPRFAHGWIPRSFKAWAPQTAEADGWHGIENSNGVHLRWTAHPVIAWPLPADIKCPCRLTVQVPVVNIITRQMATTCRLQIGDQVADLVPAHLETVENLQATIDIDDRPADNLIKLHSEQPIRPSDMSDSLDDRRLGLAILCKPAEQP